MKFYRYPGSLLNEREEAREWARRMYRAATLAAKAWRTLRELRQWENTLGIHYGEIATNKELADARVEPEHSTHRHLHLRYVSDAEAAGEALVELGL